MNQYITCADADEEHQDETVIGYCLNQQCHLLAKCCIQCTLTKHSSHSEDCKGFCEIVNIISDRVKYLECFQEQLEVYFQRFNLMKININKYIFGLQARMTEVRQVVEENQIKNLDSISDILKEWYGISEKELMNPESQLDCALIKINEIMKGFDNLLSDEVNKEIQEIIMNEYWKNFEQNKKENIILDIQVDGELQKGKQRKWKEALTCYEGILNINPNVAEAHFEKGNILQNLKKYNDAIQSYDLAIFNSQNNAQYYVNKGLVLINLERNEEAIISLDQALKLDPDNLPTYHYKGLALDNLKRFDEAIKCYDLSILPQKQQTQQQQEEG